MEHSSTRQAVMSGSTGHIASLRAGPRGVGLVFRTQRKARLQGFATLGLCAVAAWLGLGPYEWCVMILAVVMVWVAECLNTAVEALTDLVAPTYHELAGRAKDTAAGATTIAVIGTFAISAILFYRPLIAKLGLD